MTAWLIRRLIRNHENIGDPDVRAAYGTLASAVGMLINLLLAGGKFCMGLISGSVAIMADAANNLSDAAGSLVTFITVRLARKPVDADHPFGHGRMEYLGSLAVGALIVAMGLNLLIDSAGAIFHPHPIQVSWMEAAFLTAAILAKFILYLFYRSMNRRIQNTTLQAAAKDSLCDMIATGAVLLSLGLSACFGWMLDGPIGLLVSAFVLKAGYDVCRDTVDRLLGSRPDAEKIHQIREILLSHEGILGLHDLVLHDYGPGRCYASVHAEVDAEGSILEIHELIDDAEREVAQKLMLPLCIHMDPIVTSDEAANTVRKQMADFLQRFDPALSMHDFRMVPGEGHTNLIFDCVLPAGYEGRELVLQALTAYAKSLDERYQLVVVFDTDYA